MCLALSRRVFEANGSFDQHLRFTTTTAAGLHAMLTLHPSFGLAMGSPRTSGGGGGGGGGSGGGGGGGGSGGGHGGGGGGGGGGGAVVDARFKWMTGSLLLFGKGANGPKYATRLILEELKKTDSTISGSNFCMLHFLSTTKMCKNSRHTHKVSAAAANLRDSFEHQPFRIDAKAKPAG